MPTMKSFLLKVLPVIAVSLALGNFSAVAADASTNGSEASTGVVGKTESAVERGAKTVAHGVERGVNAAANGIKHGAEAALRGVERGANATSNAAHTVVRKVDGSADPVSAPASAPASTSER